MLRTRNRTGCSRSVGAGTQELAENVAGSYACSLAGLAGGSLRSRQRLSGILEGIVI